MPHTPIFTQLYTAVCTLTPPQRSSRNFLKDCAILQSRSARILTHDHCSTIFLLADTIANTSFWRQEVPGEDSYLTSEYAFHLINSTQTGSDPRYLQVAATAKHFSMYDLEGYIPRKDPGKIPSAYCDTPGGCERWNLDATPPMRDFVSLLTV